MFCGSGSRGASVVVGSIIGSLAVTPVLADVTLEYRAQWGGPATAVDAVGDTAYLGIGHRLVVIDASDPAALVLLGESAALPHAVQSITVSGQHAFVADDWPGGLAIFDVSDASAPALVGMLSGIGPARAVAVAGNFAYVAVGDMGLAVVDISTLGAPTLVTHCDTPGDAHGVAVAGSHVYVADAYGGLQVIDITDPGNPSVVGSYATADWAEDVFIRDGQAFIAASYSGGLVIVDVSNSESPSLVGTCSTDAVALDVVVAGNFAFVANSWAGLDVIDVSVPEVPVRVGQYDTPGWSLDLVMAGSNAFIADEVGGLQIIDVSAAPALEFAGEYRRTSGNVTDVAAIPGWVYLTDGMSGGGVRALDVSNPADPQLRSQVFSNEYAWGMTYVAPYVYLADGCAGFAVIDASDPTQLQRIGNVSTGCAARDVAVQGSFAYVADDHQGLLVIDISDPNAPVLRGVWQDPADPGYALGVAVAGDYAYLADNAPGLQIIDITDPDHPARVGRFDTEASQDVVVSGGLAYVADDWAGLKIVDVTDPANPVLVGACPDCWSAVGVTLVGTQALVAAMDKGVLLVDVQDPTYPEIVASYDTAGLARRIAVSGQLVHVADFSGGLVVLEMTDAGDYFWINPLGGDFTAPDNWTPEGPPGPLNRAVFALPDTYTVSMPDGADITNDRLLVNSGEVAFDLNGSTYRLAHAAESSFTIGEDDAGVVRVRDGLVLNAGRLHVAERYGSNGHLIIEGAESAGEIISAFQVIAGISGGTAAIDVIGGGARLEILGQSPSDPYDLISLELGRYGGHGALNVLAGGEVTCASFATLGGAEGGAGDALVDGGWWNVARMLEVGRGGPGTLRVENQGQVSLPGIAGQEGNLFIGGNAPGYVLVTGMETALWAAGEISVGVANLGVMTVSACGSVTVNVLIVGDYDEPGADGRLIVADYGTLECGDIARIGNNGLGSALVTRGGEFTSHHQIQVGYLDHGVVNVNTGGILNTWKANSPTGTSGIIGWQIDSIGEVTVRDGGSTWRQDGALNVGWFGSGTLRVENEGVAESADGVIARLAGSVGNVTIAGDGSSWNVADTLSIGGLPEASGGAGTVEVLDGGALMVGSRLLLWEGDALRLSGGRANVGAGPLPDTANMLAVCTNGMLGGVGAVIGDVRNAGIIGPGASAGVLTLDGNFTQESTGTLAVELAGPVAGVEYDQLAVSGTAALGGTLAVSRVDPYWPDVGAEFTVLTCDARDGEFDSVSGLALGNHRRLSIAYEATAVTLTVKPETYGDFNLDGEVDLADWMCFTDCMAGPSTSPAPPSPISVAACLAVFDSDGDSDVDLADAGKFLGGF